MIDNLKFVKKINLSPIILLALIVFTIIFLSHYNYQQKKTKNETNALLENVYFKKTLNNIFNHFEPKFKKVVHIISEGENIEGILNLYSINKDEIILLIKNYQHI